jgi:hypothetical protein
MLERFYRKKRKKKMSFNCEVCGKEYSNQICTQMCKTIHGFVSTGEQLQQQVNEKNIYIKSLCGDLDALRNENKVLKNYACDEISKGEFKTAAEMRFALNKKIRIVESLTEKTRALEESYNTTKASLQDARDSLYNLKETADHYRLGLLAIKNHLHTKTPEKEVEQLTPENLYDIIHASGHKHCAEIAEEYLK